MEHNLRVKGLLIPMIADGSKRLEIRPGFKRFRQIKPGDILIFNENVRRRVAGVVSHQLLTEAITEDNAHLLWPGHGRQEVLNRVRGFYSQWQDEYLIFELAPE